MTSPANEKLDTIIELLTYQGEQIRDLTHLVETQGPVCKCSPTEYAPEDEVWDK